MTEPSRRDRAALGLLVALVVLLPTTPAKVVLTTPSAVDDLLRRTAIHLFDPVLVAITALAIWRWVDAGPRLPTGSAGRLGAAFGIVFIAAFAANPSSHGLEVGLRIASAVAVVSEVRRLRGRQRQVLLAVVFAFGVGEAALAVLQVWNGSTLTHGPLEMWRFPLFRFGGSVAPQGSFSHPYHLACALSVALGAGFVGLRSADERHRWWWWAGFPWLGVALSMTFSRLSLAAVAVAVVVVAIGGARGSRRAVRIAAALVVAGSLAGGYAGLDGWRYKETITTNASSFDSSRSKLAATAVDVIGAHPLLGVGPGRYVQEVIDTSSSRYHLPPHNLLLQIAAEDGLAAGAIVAALAAATVVAALRNGRDAVAAFVLVAPFFVLDAFPYNYPHGFALAALWVGMLHLARDPLRDVVPRPLAEPVLVPA